jgi:hypothetical protein
MILHAIAHPAVKPTGACDMITDYKIKKCMYLSTSQLEKALNFMYPEDRVLQSKFLGITNGKQFCYEIGYNDEELGGLAFTKVFVDLDCNEEVYAEY